MVIESSKVKRSGQVFAEKGVWEEVFSLVTSYFHVGCVIADLGCGSHVWEINNAQFIRIDKSVPKEKEGYIKYDLNKGIPLSDKSVDYVVAVELIEHLENPLHFLREVKRVARKLAIITSPNGEASGWYRPSTYEKDGHVSIMADWLLEEHFRVVGLQVKEKRFNNKDEEIVIFAVSTKI